MELALFFDAGTTWSNGTRPLGLGGSRTWVRSWGAALRINLFGFVTGEVDYVRPLDLPSKTGGLWRFRLGRGF
jgi:outer membrane protein assembly factor BamA